MAIRASLVLAGLLWPALCDVIDVLPQELELGVEVAASRWAASLGAQSDDAAALANITTTAVPVVDSDSMAIGTTLAVIGGTFYAVGALIVSWVTRAKEHDGMADRTGTCFSFLAWNIMNIGGLCVTFAYQSGVSVPLLNAFVYSTNLGLNMIFQIIFKLSPYTKNMRCGTILFALAALQLGQLAPPPETVDIELIWQPQAIAWNVFFVFLFVGSAVEVWRHRDAPRNNNYKILMWSLHVACWGSFTDNWAKINGTLEGTMWWIVFIPYLPTGMWVMVLSIWAFAGTDVAIYVPTNLCIQLVMNTMSALLLWNEAERVDLLVAYLVGYVICIMAVYIATEEADLLASYSNNREISHKGLSKGKAVTAFGESLVDLARQWELTKQPASGGTQVVGEKEENAAARKKAVEQALLTGAEAKAFGKEELANLALRLWGRVNNTYMPNGTVVSWLQQTPYFEEYLAADPAFRDVMLNALTQEEQRAMVEEKQVEMQNFQQEQV